MRHIYAYRVTYLIAALIVLVAMLFAWLRSQDVPPPSEAGSGHHHVGAAAPAAGFFGGSDVAVEVDGSGGGDEADAGSLPLGLGRSAA